MIGVLGSLAQPLPVDPLPIERPGVDWGAVAPMLVLVGGALALMLASSFASWNSLKACLYRSMARSLCCISTARAP